MISVDYSEAATEVLEILNNTDKEDLKKIPENFIKFLKQNCSKSYKPNIDYSKPIEEMNLKNKTINILAIICNKYWCDDLNKIEFINMLELNEKILQEKLNEEYDFNNIFKKKRTNYTENQLILLDKKENFITKIITKIKRRFMY